MNERFLNSVSDEFGQRPTPPAGSRITEVKIRDEDHKGYFDRIKHRFVWFPLHDINFIGRMQVQPMSTDYLYRGRTAWVQSVSYKAVDNSPEAMDIDGEGELPLKNFLLTPYAQTMYLYGAYAEKGLQEFNHLKGSDPELVSFIERTILPEVPGNLLALGRYLAEKSFQNIENSDLDPNTKKLSLETLNCMREGVNVAIAYCTALIEESEAEILTRRNKGVGKAAFDKNDRFAFKQLDRDVPTENTIANSPERKTVELLERMVTAMETAKASGAPIPTVEEKNEEIDALRQQLADVQKQLADMAFMFKNLNGGAGVASGAPQLEDETVATEEEVQEDLKTRLAQTKSNQSKRK